MEKNINEQELDAKDLKIIGYKQRVSELEEQVMDLRVQLTIMEQELTRARESSESDDAGSKEEN